ncbi:hypothetical protein HK405_015755 [Cladochytrium tenue]|nr:hypothetical protein HK405_015755 [Cladochytrium tenue]
MELTYSLEAAYDSTMYNCFVGTAQGDLLGCSDWTSSAFVPVDDHAANSQQVLLSDPVLEASPEELLELAARASENHLQRRIFTTTTNPGTFTYQVVPFTSTSINDLGGTTQSVVNPQDTAASPITWHGMLNGTTITYYNAPYGNNVFAVNNTLNVVNALTIPLAFPTSSFTFAYQLNTAAAPNASLSNVQAGVTNMFYIANIMHDLFYRYGFTEAAGNFQMNNLGNGGTAGDPVVATSLDGSGTNNANFLTPKDGTSGRMRMFLFTESTPNRDGALDNSIVMHEMTHGLSNRLTGGTGNANCLQTIEAGGMGEGWSDAVAVMMMVKSTDTLATNKVVGAYAFNAVNGVRTYPYSTSLTTNPRTYADAGLAANQEVHLIGEVWCAMLYEVYWNMVDQQGFVAVDQLSASTTPLTAGNADFFNLLVKGMMLQPCNPTFVQARDAIVAAEAAVYSGTYSCAVWNGFAKRGLGVGAANFTNSFAVPTTCA